MADPLAVECSMDINARLLRVYQLDRQLAGLQSRLKAAERFLIGQTTQLEKLQTQKAALEHQIKQITASVANKETDMQALDERSEKIREQMNQARTNKEYKAFLSEINLLKSEKDTIESEALAQMAKADELREQLKTVEEAIIERTKMCDVAASEKDQRQHEIADKVEELQKERNEAASQVDAGTLDMYERLYKQREEEAMAPIEVSDQKRHEYTCGSCMMLLPMEASISLLSGKLTVCSNCQCILYITEETAELLTPSKH